MKTKLLFICDGGLDRSPAAAELFKDSKKYEARFAGIRPLISAPMTRQALQWADEIFVMEPEHKRYLLENFPLITREKPEIVILDILNKYTRNDPELEKILIKKLQERGFL